LKRVSVLIIGAGLMPTKTKLEISSFNKGLITEASPLTYPDNASLIDQNFVLQRDGSRKRRLGMDYEDGYTEDSYSGDVDQVLAISIHLWKNPIQTGGYDIVVVQVEDVLRFYRADADVISDTPINGGLPFTLPVDYSPGTKITTASLRGQLVITYNSQQILVLDYDEVGDDVTSFTTRIQIRDLFGIESAYSVEERPVVPEPLTPSDVDEINHIYNLRNQGWPEDAVVVQDSDGASAANADPTIIADMITSTKRPSNADVMWRARATSAEDAEAIGAFSPFELFKLQYGNTPAPKGTFIIDLFNRSTSRQENYDAITGDPTLLLPDDISSGYVTHVASYAGRFFYAVKETGLTGGDDKSPKISSMIFFSQTATTNSRIASCYAEADPTSEFIYDPIATDGGFISIPAVGEVLNLVVLGSSLFVISTNGVWEIHGGEQEFSATNQNITKTTAVGGYGGDSVVVADVSILYWTDSGIFAITIDPGSLRGVASNVSINTIQDLYMSIPKEERMLVQGHYDEVDRKVRWLYNEELSEDIDSDVPNKFTRELVLDVDLSAFYINTLDSEEDDPKVMGAIAIPESLYLIGTSTYLGDVFYSFGRYKNTQFLDFGTTDAKGILLTGALTGGTASTDKQIKNIVLHCARTEMGYVDDGSGGIEFDNPSGCLVTMQWGWTDSATAGRWNTPFQGYRLTVPYYPEDVDDPFDYGYTVITSKTGVRGKGKALSIKFETEEGKDLHILGWGLEVKADYQF
jgi:hypothetical protein